MPTESTVRHARLADRLGVGASTICLLHCVFAPVLFGVLPLLGVRADLYAPIEFALLSLAGGLALYSAVLGYARFQSWRLPAAFAFAVVLVIGGHVYEAHHFGRVMMLIGGFTLVVAHSVSMRCR